MRIPKEVFDEWYNGQSRYRNAEDRKKDAAAEETSITMPEMATLLGVERNDVYRILKDPQYKDIFEIIVIAARKRITIDSFEKFLLEQEQYFLVEDPGCPDPDSQNLAPGDHRDVFRKFGKNITRAQAARLAGVSKDSISAWISEGCFPGAVIGGAIRIPRKEFYTWLRSRKRGGQKDGIH